MEKNEKSIEKWRTVYERSGDVIKKGWDYLKNNGMNGVMSQVRYKLSGPGSAYNGWFKEVYESDEEAFALKERHNSDMSR